MGYPSGASIRKFVIDLQEGNLFVLTSGVRREDERKGAEDVGEIRAAEAVEMGDQGVEFVAHLLAGGWVKRGFGRVPRFAHHLLPEVGEFWARAGEAGRTGHDGVEVGVANGEARDGELVDIEHIDIRGDFLPKYPVKHKRIKTACKKNLFYDFYATLDNCCSCSTLRK